jgi:hypothetical protein
MMVVVPRTRRAACGLEQPVNSWPLADNHTSDCWWWYSRGPREGLVRQPISACALPLHLSESVEDSGGGAAVRATLERSSSCSTRLPIPSPPVPPTHNAPGPLPHTPPTSEPLPIGHAPARMPVNVSTATWSRVCVADSPSTSAMTKWSATSTARHASACSRIVSK